MSVTMNVSGVEIGDKKYVYLFRQHASTLTREHIHYNVIHTYQKCIQIHILG